MKLDETNTKLEAAKEEIFWDTIDAAHTAETNQQSVASSSSSSSSSSSASLSSASSSSLLESPATEEKSEYTRQSLSTRTNIKIRTRLIVLLTLLTKKTNQWIQAAGIKVQSSGWYQKMRQHYHDELHNTASSFYQSLMSTKQSHEERVQDLRYLKLARLFFHGCSVLPAVVYYGIGVRHRRRRLKDTLARGIDTPPKFPASISFTIRKGIPRYTQFVLWALGWSCMGKVIYKHGSTSLRRFLLHMIGTGLWTTQLFPLGHGALSDAAHFLGAGIYMVEHIVLLDVLHMHSKYRTVFYRACVALVGSIMTTRCLERRTNVPSEATVTTTTATRANLIQKLPKKLQLCFFCSELLLMVSENLLFTSFVQGIPSGFENATTTSTITTVAATTGKTKHDNDNADNDNDDNDDDGTTTNSEEEKYSNGQIKPQ